MFVRLFVIAAGTETELTVESAGPTVGVPVVTGEEEEEGEEETKTSPG